MSKTRASIGLLAAMLAGVFVPSAFAGDICSEEGTPASTVPQFRSENPGQSIWPLDAFDQVLFKPASEIPANRDSTDYITQTIPGNSSGHELFQDVAGVEGDDDWLYVAYNAGLQIWDLRVDPDDPRRELFRDGWLGQFEFFPGFGEGDTYISSIDVIASTGNNVLIALAGELGHGVSFWRWNTATEVLTQIYQETGIGVLDIKLIEHSNGRIYALGSDKDASAGGLHVFDVSAADASPCFDDNPGIGGCSTVYEGDVAANAGDSNYIDSEGSYVDAWTAANGDIYVVASDGSAKVTDPLTVEIWRLDNPENPVSPGGATRMFQGLSTNTRGVQLFEVGTSQFLAVIDVISASNTVLRIYDASNCVDGSPCGSLGSSLFNYSLPSNTGNFQYLSFSRSGSRSFLYYGLETTGTGGPRVEQLFDVSSLDDVSPAIFEITDAGANYIDPCNGQSIDYWGDYYNLNAYGNENLVPRNGRFIGNYFYRAALGILDVHELTQVDPQASIITTTESSSAWMGDPVDFGTIPGGDCVPAAGQWCWLVEIVPSAGDSVSYAPLPSDLVTGCDASFGGQQSFTFACDDADRCGDAGVGVTAWNLACGDIQDGTLTAANLTVKDPMVEVAASGSSSIQECQTAQLQGTLAGRGPAQWRWEINGSEIEGCSGNVSTATDLAAAGTQNCSWTADQFDDIFADGFESGDCSLWSTAQPPGSCVARSGGPVFSPLLGGGVTATFRAWDPAGSPDTPFDTADVNISIGPIGDPSWVTPGNPVNVEVSGNQATFTAAANDTGTWSWEFEDPQGTSTCTFPAIGTVNCETRDTTTDTTSKSWPDSGDYAYRVTASNCRSATTVEATGSVTIDPGIQPNVTSFDLGSNSSSVCCGSIAFGDRRCVAGQPVQVRVTVQETDPSFEFAFDTTRSTNSTADDANFGSPVTPSSTSGTNYFFNLTFSGTGDRWPSVQASSGSLMDFHELFAGGTGESSSSLQIVSAGGCP